MPTISELPAASGVTPADELPISQGGSACSVSVGALLAATQPAILVATGSLLGRNSLGPGGPEAVTIGTGLLLSDQTLVATGSDHAGFAVEDTLAPTDQLVVNSAGTPKLLQLGLLRGLFSAGANVTIDGTGTISAASSSQVTSTTGTYSITGLPVISAMGAGDLVAVSQGGADRTIAYANLIDGLTINQAQAAAAATDTDCFWVSQGGSTMLYQTLSGLWNWLNAKLPLHAPPIVEIVSNITLDATAHGGHVLICSQPVSISAPSGTSTAFTCELLNLSAGNVTFGPGITSCSGGTTLPSGQAVRLIHASYSGGTTTFAWTSNAPSTLALPGQVTGLTVTAATSNSLTLAWSPALPAVTSYAVQYRVSSTTTWSAAPSSTTPTCTTIGLLPGSSYDFVVSAVNASGTGVPSAIITASTSASLSIPGQVAGLTVTAATSSTISLSWSVPVSGGTPANYTVQYRLDGTTNWQTGPTGLTVTTATVTGLTAASSYDFQVTAVNASGNGMPSAVTVTSTATLSTAVTAVTWNVVPSGSYVHGSGALGINAHISPGNAAVQFGLSQSNATPPSSWVVANYVNTDLWGAYVATPATSGTWFAWVEGIDGSCLTVYPVSFTVT